MKKSSKQSFTVIKNGTITTPAGFVACGLASGIKPQGKPDLAMIVSSKLAAAAGTFTTNQVKAAPVQVSMKHLQASKGQAQVILANSGNANACTGVTGIQNAKETARLAAKATGCKKDSHVLVCSTGRIGRPLPMDILRNGIAKAAGELSDKKGLDAAKAIMTSDSVHKQVAVQIDIDGKKVTVAGCAKGAGMIDPMMATMLCFITTDAAVPPKVLSRCLIEAVEQSFNRICVDGDMSTNDTVLMLANGEAQNNPLKSYHLSLGAFQEALNFVTLDLAKKIVLDGEGVSRFVEVLVKGAYSLREAKIAAETITKSALVKASWCGGDPNWGRLMAALGYSSARVREELVDIYYDGLLAVKHGLRSDCPDAKLKKVVAKKSFKITIDLHLGSAEHTVYTTDLTEDYVTFNKGE